MTDLTPEEDSGAYRPPVGPDLTELVQPKPVAPKRTSDDEPRIQTELAAKVLVPLVVLLCLLVSFLMIQVGGMSDSADKATKEAQEAIDQTAKNRENGAKNRAAVCSLNIAVLGQAGTPKVCFDKDILEFYNPDKVAPVASPEGQEYNTKLLCSIIYPGDPAAQVKCAEEDD